jgi:uracil-DNA glycosylase
VNVFNPWRDEDPLDTGNGVADRCVRLSRHFDIRPKLLLIGEAPGYQGCHFSGVPFTNEKLILGNTVPRISATGRITTRQRPFCEPSATIVWSILHQLGIANQVVMWNAFAWHPHKPGDLRSNRSPTCAELESGLPVLRLVLKHFDSVPIVPIGRVAEKALRDLGCETLPAIRHPSMGGANKFRAGMATLVEKLVRGRYVYSFPTYSQQ